MTTDPIDSLRHVMDERDRRYMERFKAAEDSVRMAFASAEKALDKAELASQKRFESVNEFRAAMQDMQGTFARADVVEARLVAIQKKMDELSAYRSDTMGRAAGMQQGWGWIVSGVTVAAAVVGAVVALFLK